MSRTVARHRAAKRARRERRERTALVRAAAAQIPGPFLWAKIDGVRALFVSELPGETDGKGEQ